MVRLFSSMLAPVNVEILFSDLHYHAVSHPIDHSSKHPSRIMNTAHYEYAS